jgi:ABC-type phosphate transport system substrate-binding protein
MLALANAAAEGRYKVIVSPKNPVTSIDRDFLRNAYLKKETEWNGQTIRPVDLSKTFPVRDQFTREVLKKTPAQLKSYWSQQVFSGKGVPPPVGETTADVIAYVLANPGAIGYLPDDVDPGGAKIVEVK